MKSPFESITVKKGAVVFNTERKVIAVTGNIASGKSAAQKCFESWDIPCLDVDQVTQELYLTDQKLIADVKEICLRHHFTALQNDMFIDKKKLKTLVFQNKALRKELESVVHPAIQKKVRAFVAAHADREITAVFIPLLLEANMAKEFDYVVTLTVDPETQLRRLLERNPDLTEEMAKQRINSQLPQFVKEGRADFVIDNSGTLGDLSNKVMMLLSTLRGNFGAGSNLIRGIPGLKYDWAKMTDALKIPKQVAQDMFEKLVNAYDDKGRAYHGIKHLNTILDEIAEFKKYNAGLVQEPDLLTLAVFMHDYIQQSGNDVEKSADIAVAFLQQSESADVRAKTDLLRDMILATEHNRPMKNPSVECQLIKDADLAVLGAGENAYALYQKQIRYEYQKYSDSTFSGGRQAVLVDFLKKPTVYQLPYFQKKYERQARKNMAIEANALLGIPFIDLKHLLDKVVHAVYAGSFDPITKGHMDIVKSAAEMYDKVTVLVAKNPAKDGFIPVEDRVRLIQEAVRAEGLSNVVADCAPANLLTVEYARQHQAGVLIRGLRTVTDFDAEMQLAEINKKLNQSVRTVFLTSNSEYSAISSSAVRGILKCNGHVDNFVPPCVAAYLKKMVSAVPEQAQKITAHQSMEQATKTGLENGKSFSR